MYQLFHLFIIIFFNTDIFFSNILFIDNIENKRILRKYIAYSKQKFSPVLTEEAMEETTEAPATIDPAAATGEAPSRFIGNWKDSSKAVMVITWKAPAGDVKSYKVETRSNQGAWNVVSEISATTYAAEFAKKSEDGSTSFRVTAVYADGSLGVAKAFGFAGQFE